MFNKKMPAIILIILGFSFFTVVNAQSKESVKEKSKTEMQKNHRDKSMAEEKASAKPWNEVCPVKGNKVSSQTLIVEHNGKAYGFCCPGCDSKFEKDPEKYSKNLSEDGKKYIGKK